MIMTTDSLTRTDQRTIQPTNQPTDRHEGSLESYTSIQKRQTVATSSPPRWAMGAPRGTGFPIKEARFSKLKNMPDLLSDDEEGKIKENID